MQLRVVVTRGLRCALQRRNAAWLLLAADGAVGTGATLAALLLRHACYRAHVVEQVADHRVGLLTVGHFGSLHHVEGYRREDLRLLAVAWLAASLDWSSHLRHLSGA